MSMLFKLALLNMTLTRSRRYVFNVLPHLSRTCHPLLGYHGGDLQCSFSHLEKRPISQHHCRADAMVDFWFSALPVSLNTVPLSKHPRSDLICSISYFNHFTRTTIRPNLVTTVSVWKSISIQPLFAFAVVLVIVGSSRSLPTVKAKLIFITLRLKLLTVAFTCGYFFNPHCLLIPVIIGVKGLKGGAHKHCGGEKLVAERAK